MTILKLTIPQKGLISPSTWGSKEAIKGQLLTTWEKFSSFFRFSAKESGIPVEILLSFCVVESGGNPLAGTGANKGLFQFNHNYVKSQLKDEFTSGRLTDNEKSKLAQYGFNFDSAGNTREFTSFDAVKPELNILIGAILLGQLIDQDFSQKNGDTRMDIIIVVYNSGYYSKWSKIAMKSKSINAKQLHDELSGNNTTQSYIRKMLGVGGALDIATSDLASIVR